MALLVFFWVGGRGGRVNTMTALREIMKLKKITDIPCIRLKILLRIEHRK